MNHQITVAYPKFASWPGIIFKLLFVELLRQVSCNPPIEYLCPSLELSTLNHHHDITVGVPKFCISSSTLQSDWYWSYKCVWQDKHLLFVVIIYLSEYVDDRKCLTHPQLYYITLTSSPHQRGLPLLIHFSPIFHIQCIVSTVILFVPW